MSNFFKRDAEIYISTDTAIYTAANTVKLNVSNFGYDVASRSDTIENSSISSSAPRIRSDYVQRLASANLNFTTYMAPITDTNVTSPEENLWVGLLGNASAITNSPISSVLDFSHSGANAETLQNLTIWVRFPEVTTLFKFDNVIVDEAVINLDLNNLCTIDWSCRALTMSKIADTPPDHTDRTVYTGCVRNKLTATSLVRNSISYNVAITGGRIRINNNNTIYGRTKLGEVTTPSGHYTGTRDIIADISFYAKVGANNSLQFWEDLFADINSNLYDTRTSDLIINIGGSTGTRVVVDIPQAFLNLPSNNIDDVVQLENEFIAQESASNFVNITYYN